MLTASAVSLGNTVAFGYDPLGRRVSKVSTGTLNTSTTYLSDGDREIAEYDGTGATLQRRYVYGPGIDEPIVRVDVSGVSSAHYYTHQDGLGSVVAVTDNTGAVVEKDGYGVYGESASLTGNPYRFTGRRLDPETGLYYYRARYYSASLGRFMQNDPIGYDGGDNLYAYVGNDPINLNDPTGLLKYSLSVDAATYVAIGVNVSLGVYYDSDRNVAGTSFSLGGGVGLDASLGGTFAIEPSGYAMNSATVNIYGSLGPVSSNWVLAERKKNGQVTYPISGDLGGSYDPSLTEESRGDLGLGAYMNGEVDLEGDSTLLTGAVREVEGISSQVYSWFVPDDTPGTATYLK